MNIEGAKLIPIEQLLQRLGYYPSRRQAQVLWYLSPFRKEKTASFKVDLGSNRWVDFGDGSHGDGIDLLMRICRLNSVSMALSRLGDIFGGEVPSLCEPLPKRAKAAAIEITGSGPIQSKSLSCYLRQRRINPKLVEPYVVEVHYRVSGKDYFAIGFANDSGGYELRNSYFKGCSSKDISTVGDDPSRVMLFEGFFDFLTAVSQFKGRLHGTAVILNSVALKDKGAQAIRELNPAVIDVYRDDDKAGRELLAYLKHELAEPTIVDWSCLYQGYGDLNAWHVATN